MIDRLIAWFALLGLIYFAISDLASGIENMGKWQMVEYHKMVTQR